MSEHVCRTPLDAVLTVLFHDPEKCEHEIAGRPCKTAEMFRDAYAELAGLRANRKELLALIKKLVVDIEVAVEEFESSRRPIMAELVGRRIQPARALIERMEAQ